MRVNGITPLPHSPLKGPNKEEAWPPGIPHLALAGVEPLIRSLCSPGDFTLRERPGQR